MARDINQKLTIYYNENLRVFLITIENIDRHSISNLC